MKIRTFYFCENCDTVHVAEIGRPKCPICNGDLTALDGLQSVVNAIIKDKSIEIPFSFDMYKDITERPFMGWTSEGHKHIPKT